MASYQEIETRLSAIEEKVMFIMRNIRMRVAAEVGILDAQGKPQIQHIDGSIDDFYRHTRQEAK